MKNLLLTFCILTTGLLQVQAQSGPAASPASLTTQTIGMTEVTVEYSRPSMKDRTVFGGLVPYGKVWRTGANAATKVTCSTDMNIGGAELKEGSYALLVVPNKETWELRFFPYNSGRWGTYTDTDVEPMVGHSSAITEMGFDVESFVISFNNLRDETATMQFIWERTNVSVDVTVPGE